MFNNEEFNQDDMTELEGIFTSMIEDNENGFTMEFVISRLSAKEIILLWEQAAKGDCRAQVSSWNEYTKIVNELREALEEFPG